MAVNKNTATSADVVSALDIEFVESFTNEYSRLAEMLGLFSVQTASAGTALYQYNVAGSMVDGKVEPSYTAAVGDTPAAIELGSSSGKAYVEGDFITRSKYTLDKVLIGEVSFIPYAKQTTANAIQKAGYTRAVLRTDRKARQQMRASIMSDFFAFLANNPKEAEGSGDLQAALAYVDATLGDVLEGNDDEGGDIIHFVNRQDAAGYLANAFIVSQSAFGMTYLENFLGVENVVLTSKVAKGSVFATPAENIRVYGLDFGALGEAGLHYETDDLGLVGVHHAADYDRGSVETYLVRGTTFVPEVTDYIVKGTVSETSRLKVDVRGLVDDVETGEKNGE